VNLGSGEEQPISRIAAIVAEATGFVGQIRWDRSRPNGQPRRNLDISKAESAFGFRASTPFATGIARTVDWYRSMSALAR
jgi:GDP-L-fucose synthase